MAISGAALRGLQRRLTGTAHQAGPQGVGLGLLTGAAGPIVQAVRAGLATSPLAQAPPSTDAALDSPGPPSYGGAGRTLTPILAYR